MARYERDDEFWDITKDGLTITITTGKIGEAGTTTVEQLATAAMVSTRWNVLQNQQTRAGFKIYKPPVEAALPTEASLPPPPIMFDARNPELERAIEQDPEGDAAYEVYGDWLQSQGDPRGRLIGLEVAARGKPFGDKHHVAVDRLAANNQEYLLGSFAKRARGHSLLLHWGFVRAIELISGRLARPLAKALALPGSRFVTRIHIDAEGDDAKHDAVAKDLADAIMVIGTKSPPTLRHLVIGGDTKLESLDPLVACLPQLRTFGLINVQDRQLSVSPACLGPLVRSPWPRLETLSLELLAGSCKLDHLMPLLIRSDLPKLVELSFRTTFDDSLAKALASSPLAAQIERLTFEAPGGEHTTGRPIGDALAAVLVGHRDRFPKLRELGIPHNRLSPAALASLQMFGKVRDADGQARYEHSSE
ncbi:MAG: TIGR02996 domain-containing protein [Deltaproteobacteria bacterium]|nr:TIGR02996 domain-containing protein [Deltaproteobacteria bacterium]